MPNKFNPQIHHRRSIRLKGYDYSQSGLYFITICCQDRACLFGQITVGASLVDAPTTPTKAPNTQTTTPTNTTSITPNTPTTPTTTKAQMVLNDAGKMIETEWFNLKLRFHNIELHEYVVMPNHFHAILEIVGPPVGAPVGAPLVGAQNILESQNNNESQMDQPPVRAPLVGAQNIMESQLDQPPVRAPLVGAPNITESQLGQPQGLPLPKRNKTIGDMMDAFKSITTVAYIRGVKTNGWQPFTGKLWQRNYYEHIIRNEQSLQRIGEYIENNPTKWAEDKFFK